MDIAIDSNQKHIISLVTLGVSTVNTVLLIAVLVIISIIVSKVNSAFKKVSLIEKNTDKNALFAHLSSLFPVPSAKKPTLPPHHHNESADQPEERG